MSVCRESACGRTAGCEQHRGPFSGTQQNLFIVCDRLELRRNILDFERTPIFGRVLKGFELRVESEPAVLMFDGKPLSFLKRERYGDQLVGDAIELRVTRIVVGAGAVTVRPGIGEGFLAGKSHVKLGGFAGDGEKVMR